MEKKRSHLSNLGICPSENSVSFQKRLPANFEAMELCNVRPGAKYLRVTSYVSHKVWDAE